MENKTNRYNKLVQQLDLLKQEKNKIDFNIQKLKEIIDEFETNHLDLNLNKKLNSNIQLNLIEHEN